MSSQKKIEENENFLHNGVSRKTAEKIEKKFIENSKMDILKMSKMPI